MPSLTPVVYALSLLIHFQFSFALLYMMMFTWDTCVKLVLLLVVLLTPLIYPSQFMLMALTALLGSVHWDVIQML